MCAAEDSVLEIVVGAVNNLCALFLTPDCDFSRVVRVG